MTDNSAGIAQLQRIYGNLDKDVLAAVLEVCGGDSKAAAQFLQAQGNEGYDARQLQNNEGIPKDYPGAGSKSSQPVVLPASQKDKDPAEITKSLFINENITYKEHYDAQVSTYDLYVSVLLLLINQGVDISKGSRPRILASAWARKDKHLASFLLSKEEVFGLPAVLGALNLLDAERKTRSIEKKISRLEKQGTVKAKKLGQLKSTLNDLKREAHIGSVSGALAKEIRRWVQKIPQDKLEFYALSLPKEPWQELADIVHLNPKDFQCKWFLEYIYGKDAPSDSFIHISQNLVPETLAEILKKHPIPYSYLRVHVKPIFDDAKAIIATYSPIDTVIWYHEELVTPEVDKIINKRLDSEFPNFGYGKLMERLLYFRSIKAVFFKKLMPVAESRLKAIDLQLESPVVVVGDASYSMDVAIRTATVISSVLTALCGADLKFFNGEPVTPPVIPRSVKQVLDVASGTKADGLTAAAAGLWPYYEAKKVVKFFIVVTDEIDNEKYKGHYFPTLFQKYCKEVFPAKIVFVSFLDNPSEKGRMVKALESMGIIPLQFRLDGKRPDLTKLDSLLGLLSSESSHFPKQAEKVRLSLKEKGLDNTFQSLSNQVNTTTTSSKADDKEEENVENNNNVQVENKAEVKQQDKKGAKKELKKEVVMDSKPKVEVDEQSKYCIICEEREVQVALLDCGHLSFCQPCAEPLKECPICRREVVRFIRIYTN